MMKSAVLMMLAAMAINSCSTSKNVNKEIRTGTRWLALAKIWIWTNNI